MGKIIICEGSGANLAYCPEHDWWYTVRRWITWNEPFWQCPKCRGEYNREWHKWHNKVLKNLDKINEGGISNV